MIREGEFGDHANSLTLFRVAMVMLSFGTDCIYGGWAVYLRCRDCGAGYGIASPSGPQVETAGPRRWLCPACGAGVNRLITWVGQVNKIGMWQWKPAKDLPPDLQPKALHDERQAEIAAAVEAALPARLDAEFEARVRAAVEVEVAARMRGLS